MGAVIKGWDKAVATMKKGEKSTVTCTAPYAYGESGAPPTIPPDATLVFEIELLHWKSVKDISGDGGIIKKVLAEGSGWEKPREKDEVQVVFTAKKADGTVFEESGDDGALFVVGEGFFCPALAKVVTTMQKGERVTCEVKPRYGFAEEGYGEKLGPNESFTLEVEVQSWRKVSEVPGSDGMVVKKQFKEGEGYEKPNEGSTITAKYTLCLADGTEVEKCQDEPRVWTNDEDMVVPGLDLAVLDMRKGEVAEIKIQPQMGFGGQEQALALGHVPTNSVLVYMLELVDFVRVKESYDLNNEEKVQAAEAKKAEANALYKDGKLDRALKRYAKALTYVDADGTFNDDEKREAKKLRCSLNLNMAAVHLKQKDAKQTISKCNKALDIEFTNVKALYRRAQALVLDDCFVEAEADLKKILEIDEDNREAKLELRKLKVKMKEQSQKESKLYGNMFERMRKLEARETPVTNGTSGSNGTNGEAAGAEGEAPVAAEEANAA
eukprot:scaffold356_cov363-Prasinococcus_capsulatus_cf.AAC.3